MNEIVRSRTLIWELSKADFKKRFVGSYFGVVWMFVQPVVTVLIYFMVFQMGFKSVPPVPGVPYVLWLVPGIVPWFFFSEALNTGTSCLSEYHYLVKKVVFQVEALPVIKLVSCAIVHGIFVAIMIAVFFCYGRLPMLTWFQILYYSFALSVNVLALSLFTAAINVFFKDMAQLVAICHVIEPVVDNMLSVFISGAAHGEKIFASLKRHPLPKFHLIAVSCPDRLNLTSLKHGIGAAKIRPLFVPQCVGKNGLLQRCVKANHLPDRKFFSL